MIKRMIIMLLVCGLVLGGVFGYKAFGNRMMKKYMAAASNPPQTVSTIKAAFHEWQPEIKAVGSLHAVKGADLAPEVAGIVESINFESGDEVEEGKVLIHMRDEYDVAQLKALEAAAKLAEITLQRNQKQLKAQAVSQATVDADKSNLDAALAQVLAQKANVDKKAIRAPFSGRTGIRKIDVGQYVNPGQTVVTLQQLDPIFVDFHVPEQKLPLVQKNQKVTVKVDAQPDKIFEGEIAAINAKIDSATRNVQVRAEIKNPEHLLLPGMFATVNIQAGATNAYITLPQTAVTHNPYGSTVFVIETKPAEGSNKPSLTAVQKFVVTDGTRGDQIAIVSGLAEGDEVVTSGQIKLRNNTPVIVNNSIQPLNEAQPNLKDE
jgi:membrane fusion protein (multidrug efflux system)